MTGFFTLLLQKTMLGGDGGIVPGVSSHQHTITRARVWTQPRVLSVTQCRVTRVLTLASVAQWPPRERLLVQCCEGRTYFTGLGGAVLGCTQG